MPAPGRDAGLTLVETLTVLVVAALAASLAVPLTGSATRDLALSTAMEDLRATLRRARGLALAQGLDAVVVVDVAARRYALDGASARAFPPGAEVSVIAAESETLPGGTAAIRFHPDGTATGGVVTLVAGGARHRVSVDWFDGAVSPVEVGSHAP